MSNPTRFTVPLDYFRDIRIQCITEESIVMHLSLIALSIEQGTQGFIPDEICEKYPHDALDQLLDRDLIVTTAGGYHIPGWEAYNPHTPERKASASTAAHTRWHTKLGKYNPDCEQCQAEKSGACNG